MMTPRLNSFGLSDIGYHRPNNEDVWIARPDIGFFALADGMGGHRAGEVAAKEAIDSLYTSMQGLYISDCMELIIELRHAIEKANRWVFDMGRSTEELLGMGTTLCCLLWRSETVVYAHVGDSRIYRLRNQKLHLLTQDHSLLSQWLTSGRLAEMEEPSATSCKHVITRAVGTAERANPEIAVSTHLLGDLYLLCTDGLTDVLSLDEMEEILNATPNNLEMASEMLIQMAKFKGSPDNMTLLLVQSE